MRVLLQARAISSAGRKPRFVSPAALPSRADVGDRPPRNRIGRPGLRCPLVDRASRRRRPGGTRRLRHGEPGRSQEQDRQPLHVRATSAELTRACGFRNAPVEVGGVGQERLQSTNLSGTHMGLMFPTLETKTLDFREFLERMKGLEPSTFCMARASDGRARSRPLAQTACLQGLRPSERTRPNPSEHRPLPFLPRLSSWSTGREIRGANIGARHPPAAAPVRQPDRRRPAAPRIEAGRARLPPPSGEGPTVPRSKRRHRSSR